MLESALQDFMILSEMCNIVASRFKMRVLQYVTYVRVFYQYLLTGCH